MKITLKTTIATLLLVLLFSNSTTTTIVAQVTSIKAHLDSTELWIGQQSKLKFQWQQHKKQTVIPPHFSDSIVQWLQIVQQPTIDTIQNTDDNIDISINYTVTSFEDTLIYIPPFPFIIQKDTVWSNALSIKIIQPFKIDTTQQKLADIKPIYQPPFDWKNLFKRIILIILIIAIILVAIYYTRKYLRQKDKQPKKVESDGITITAYQEAILALNKIKEEKQWRIQAQTKQYYTQLTDILRKYIENTYRINTLEMTSDEILHHIRPCIKKEHDTIFQILKEILTLSDLVKFAKWAPREQENEISLTNTYQFVEQTNNNLISETQDNVKDSEDDI